MTEPAPSGWKVIGKQTMIDNDEVEVGGNDNCIYDKSGSVKLKCGYANC